MKRTLLSFLTLLPLFSFAQASSNGNMASDLVMFLIGIGVCILVFLVLRQLFLWYWKVDVIIKKQDEQTQLLRSIYNSIEENNKLNRKLS